MRLPALEVHAPAALDEVFALLAEHGAEARLYAGGTDLLPGLQRGKLRCRQRVARQGVAGLDGISWDTERGLEIGACALLDQVQRHPAVAEHYPALEEAIRVLATVQVRNKATVAGNLCNASPCADTGPPLMAYGARMGVAGPSGRREAPLEDFVTGPGQVALEPGELIEKIAVPPPAAELRSIFLKFSPRSKVDISAVSVAAALRLDGGLVRGLSLFLGTVAPKPMRAAVAERELEGQAPDAAAIGRAAAAARAECSPITDFRASADYKRHLVEVLVRRALCALTEDGA